MSTPPESTIARIGTAPRPSLPADAETTPLPPPLHLPAEGTNEVFARLLDVTDDPGVKGFLRRILIVAGMRTGRL